MIVCIMTCSMLQSLLHTDQSVRELHGLLQIIVYGLLPLFMVVKV